MFRCKGCNIFAVIASLLIGIGIALLVYYGLIPLGLIENVAFLPIITATITLLALVVVPLFAHRISPCALKCVCIYGYCLLGAAAGSLITTIIALIIIPNLIALTVLIGLIVFFFSLLFLTIVDFIICLLRELCCRC